MFQKPLNIELRIRWFFLLLLTISAVSFGDDKIIDGIFRVKHNVKCYIPCPSNIPMDKKNENITHLIIAVYSSGSNVFRSCLELLEKHDEQKDNTIIISPRFLTNAQVGDNPEENLLYWNVRPFYGSSISTTKSFEGDLRISAYNVLEDIIAGFCEKKIFPNLKRITILGHSAGGQMVQRFAASNTVEFDKARPQGIKIKYIAMNPSSYVYMSGKRSVDWSVKNFAIPSEEEIAKNPGYDNYSYGLNALYSFHRRKGLTREKIRELYPQRNVVYLLGKDDCVQDGSMSTNPSAMIEGRNRLERGRIYYGHLIDEFGPEIKKNQQLRIVDGVGHNGKGMILSTPSAISILK